MVKLALHDLLKLKLYRLDGTDIASAIVLGETMDVELSFVDVCNVVVLEVQNFLGMLDERGSVGGQEELSRLRHAIVRQESAGLRSVEERFVGWSEEAGAWGQKTSCGLLDGNIVVCLLSRKSTATLGVLDVDKINLHLFGGLDAHNQWRTLSGCDNFMGVVDRFEEETESALKLLDDSLCKGGEVNIWVGIVEEFGKFCNAFSIGVSLEFEALALKESLELFVVRDDAVVDNGELPLGIGSRICQLSIGRVLDVFNIPVWMAVQSGRLAVCGPTSVRNTRVGVKGLCHVDAGASNELTELDHFAHLFECKDLILLVAVNSETSRVVSSVL